MASGNAAVTCFKILLTVYNAIFWLTGAAILALGVWMKAELYMYMELTSVYNESAPWILVGVGCVIIVVASLGCCCTFKGTTCLLYVYAAVLVVVFIVDLGISISLFVYKGKVDEGFKEGLETSLKEYATDEDTKEAMDHLQQKLDCCGNENYKDWYSVSWDGQAPSAHVPKSCCKVAEDQCDTKGETDIYTQGCHAKVSDFMKSNFNIVAGAAIAFSFIQLIGSFLACCLGKRASKEKYERMA